MLLVLDCLKTRGIKRYHSIILILYVLKYLNKYKTFV